MMAEKIKRIRTKHKLTQKELAEKLSVGASAVSSWELGSNKPLMDKLSIMADMFNVPISYFFDREELGDYSNRTMLPIYGNVSCGNGSVIYEETAEYGAAPKEWATGGNYFYLRATGNSMTGASINEGDLLLIREQPSVENGEIAAIVIDDEVVLKRVYKQNGSYILTSENPSYPPRTFNPETDKNIKVIGRLKKSITNY